MQPVGLWQTKSLFSIILARKLYYEHFYTTYDHFSDDSVVAVGVAATPKKSENRVKIFFCTRPRFMKFGVVLS